MGRRNLLSRDRYDAMIRMCGHKGDVERAEALLQLMQADGYEVTIETYNMVVNACTQSGDVERAEWHVEQMQRQGLEPDMVTFNSLLNGLAAVGDLKGVEDCFRKMSALGVTPNCVTFGTICKAFARVGDVEKVESVMQALDAAGHTLNEYFFASLIAACGAARPPRSAKAERAFAELVRRGLRPHSVKSALVRAVGKKRAMALMHGCRRSEDDERSPSPTAGGATPVPVAPPPGLAAPAAQHARPTGPSVPAVAGAMRSPQPSPVGLVPWPARLGAAAAGGAWEACGSSPAEFAEDEAIVTQHPEVHSNTFGETSAASAETPMLCSLAPMAMADAGDAMAYIPGATLRTVLEAAGH